MSTPGSFLIRGALGTGGVQILSVGLTFATAAALARTLGRDGFGIYSFALTWSVILLGPATFGFGPVVTRETAAGVEMGAWDKVYGVRHAAARTAMIATSVVSLCGLPAIALAAYTLGEQTASALLVSVIITAIGAASLLTRHRLLGLRRVVAAQFAESILRPGLLLLLLLAAVAAGLPLRAPHGAAIALGLYALASAGTLVFSWWQADVAMAEAKAPACPAVLATDPGWRRSGSWLLLNGVARDLNAEAGVLLMGAMLSAGDVGLYRAAQRLASIPTFVLGAINLSFQPVAASLYAKGDLKNVEILGIRASRVSVLLSLPIIAVFFLFGDRLLDIFGEGFDAALPVLQILALGHLFNVACGSVGVILVAAKREDDAAKGLMFSCVVTLVATVVGIETAGILGAAGATALGLVVWNVTLSWFTWERLGILPAAFSWRWRRW